ncbi:hypothetical protein [Luteimonas sp. MC1572]|uniref:hypothetical protein n=1 Tax=Luteimonas sp. MC1572 TaxID=2799325 RepID=UPI0018F0EE18|nr:hypothetical protein [Luteimonas sp. MC1572]MBJ6982249.1 hypothetical protein [Luteimonas sp. MC1572]QQO03523.1 hypothetical protein JGR64_01750 [Luteimonas sp. MC1572]
MATSNFAFHFPKAWDAQDLANAVPLRLSELPAFDALADGRGGASANGAARVHHVAPESYLHNPDLPPFHIG